VKNYFRCSIDHKKSKKFDYDKYDPQGKSIEMTHKRIQLN